MGPQCSNRQRQEEPEGNRPPKLRPRKLCPLGRAPSLRPTEGPSKNRNEEYEPVPNDGPLRDEKLDKDIVLPCEPRPQHVACYSSQHHTVYEGLPDQELNSTIDHTPGEGIAPTESTGTSGSANCIPYLPLDNSSRLIGSTPHADYHGEAVSAEVECGPGHFPDLVVWS